MDKITKIMNKKVFELKLRGFKCKIIGHIVDKDYCGNLYCTCCYIRTS